MINRPDYIEAIEPFIDKPLVKEYWLAFAAAASQPFLKC